MVLRIANMPIAANFYILVVPSTYYAIRLYNMDSNILGEAV